MAHIVCDGYLDCPDDCWLGCKCHMKMCLSCENKQVGCTTFQGCQPADFYNSTCIIHYIPL